MTPWSRPKRSLLVVAISGGLLGIGFDAAMAIAGVRLVKTRTLQGGHCFSQLFQHWPG